MAQHAENHIVYYISVPKHCNRDLRAFRHWSHLSIAFDAGLVWVKGFSEQEIKSPEVLCLPNKIIYQAADQYLFKTGNLLPEQRIPNLLWSPIERGLPLMWPKQNHNFFGIKDRINVQLVTNETEREAVAMITTMDVLAGYIETAPKVRIGPLQWILLSDNKVLLIGSPLLPLPGETLWLNQAFLIPSGYQLKHPVLTETINTLINPENDCWVVWNKESRYFLVPGKDVRMLRISSFRRTIISTPLNDRMTE